MKYKKLNDREEAIVMVTLGVPVYFYSRLRGEYIQTAASKFNYPEATGNVDYYVRDGSDE